MESRRTTNWLLAVIAVVLGGHLLLQLMPQVQAAPGAPAAPAPNWVLMAGCRKPNSMTDCNPTPLLVDKKGRVFTVFGK
jgi:hypothetical protein